MMHSAITHAAKFGIGSLLTLALATGSATARDFGIALHGGAGTILKEEMTEEQEARYREKLAEAVTAGYALLERGEPAMDAVVAAIRILEDSPLFNAGYGAVYTYDGQHELDASIMDGATLDAGAVTGVRHVQNPIELARLVMEQSPHVMLMGAGAEEFALTQGVSLVPNQSFGTPGRYESLEKARKKLMDAGDPNKDYQALGIRPDYKFGTVGAVALDRKGNLAAGTSTGGMTAKRYGRIGDSPIIGAGTWADNASCAVSATGHGEYFIRYHVAADICSRVKYQGVSARAAADTVIKDVLLPAGGTGGVIVIDSAGNVSFSFNTEGMYRASRTSARALETGIYSTAAR